MSSNEQIRVHVHGAQGRMGQACVEALQGAADMEFVGGTDFGFYWTGTTHANMAALPGRWAAYVAFGEALGWMQPPMGWG